jgi:hypothetical protein
VTAIIEKEVATRISLGSSAGITPEQIKKIIAEEVEKNMPTDVATISQINGLVNNKIKDYDRERSNSTAVAIPPFDYVSDIFIKGSAVVIGNKLIYTTIYCVSGANPVGAVSTMAITASQMYIMRLITSPQSDRQIKSFKNMTYTKIIGPQPSIWKETLLDFVTIGSCLGLTVLTFFVSNKIETRWKARVFALATAASALRMKTAAKAISEPVEEEAHEVDPELQAINAANALVRSLPPTVNLGERVAWDDVDELIDRGEQILRIGPRLCFKNTPDEVLTRLTTNPLVKIINPRPEGAPEPRPAEPRPAEPRPNPVPNLRDYNCDQLLTLFINNKWGEQLNNIDTSRAIDRQVATKPGDSFLVIQSNPIVVFKNPPAEVLEQVTKNYNVQILKIT